MGVIAVGPGGRAQLPARDDRYRPVLELVLTGVPGCAHCMRTASPLGHPHLSPVCRTMAIADDVRRGLNRSARYWCSCGQHTCTRKHTNLDGCPRDGQRISCQAVIVRDAAGKLRVQFTLFDKAEAMRQVVATYGPDPNNWPYFARRRQLKSRKGKPE